MVFYDHIKFWNYLFIFIYPTLIKSNYHQPKTALEIVEHFLELFAEDRSSFVLIFWLRGVISWILLTFFKHGKLFSWSFEPLAHPRSVLLSKENSWGWTSLSLARPGSLFEEELFLELLELLFAKLASSLLWGNLFFVYAHFPRSPVCRACLFLQ